MLNRMKLSSVSSTQFFLFVYFVSMIFSNYCVLTIWFKWIEVQVVILPPVSPYLKTLSMVTCSRLMHLMESFSTPWFLFAKPTNHYLVFYMLEIFNNIIQYQFDGEHCHLLCEQLLVTLLATM